MGLTTQSSRRSEERKGPDGGNIRMNSSSIKCLEEINASSWDVLIVEERVAPLLPMDSAVRTNHHMVWSLFLL